MTTDRIAVEALARRLDILERQNRRLRSAVVAMAIAAGAATTARVARAAAAPITSERFTVVDVADRTRATLENGRGHAAGAMLTFFDQAGNPAVKLGIGDKGPTFEVTDRNGKRHDYFGGLVVRPATQ